jgi:hypothetical protein
MSTPLRRLLKAVTSLLVPAIVIFFLTQLLTDARPPAEPRPANSGLKFITWADPNTPDWDQKLHISGIRMGCSAQPVNCLKAASDLLQSHPNARIFLSGVLKPGELDDYAQEYSKLSQESPFLEEVGVDDFVGQYARLFRSGVGDPVATLGKVINGLKSQNKNMHFGITLYENELDSPFVQDPKMPTNLRNGVDYVHLFLIYRENAKNYESYVRKVKKIFPNAKIIGGVYAYDRISYVPCAQSGSHPCTAAEELNLFKQALDIQLRLLKSGELDWLEFFPGAYGNEASWNGWDRPRICPGRKQECITNTLNLREAVADALAKEVN